jgi:thiol-disulfide isomerase/thioredoxin
MKSFLCAPLIFFLPAILNAQATYTVGDIVEDYTFTDFRTGESISLHDLGNEQGGVLVLEWYAYWCPFCASSAANVEKGIVEYYNGSNSNGVPVRHIAINVQGNAESQGLQFADRYGFGRVLEDFDRSFFSLFNPGGGQPLFVVLNAEPNSSSAAQWEVLYTRLNYAGNQAPDISALMRPVIDSIMPGGEDVDPVLAVFPGASGPNGGYYAIDWFGWFYANTFPWVFSLEFGYLYFGGEDDDTVIAYDPDFGWFYTTRSLYPALYSYKHARWLRYSVGTSGYWFFDYKIGDWRGVDLLGS